MPKLDRHTHGLALAAMVAMLILAGCAGPAARNRLSPIATTTPEGSPAANVAVSPLPAPAADASALPFPQGDGKAAPPAAGGDEPVIVLERTGGFAGRHDTWSIYAGGRVLAPGQRSAQLTPDQVQGLLAEIEASGFYQLDDSYGRFDRCNDCYNFRLTVQGRAHAKTVSGLLGAGDMPAELTRVLNRITLLLPAW